MTQPLEGKPLLVAEPKLPLPYLNSLTCSVPFLRKEPPSPTGRVWLSLKSKRGGYSEWQVLAGGGYWRGAWGRHPCARARRLKDDPAMQLLGQEPLRRGKSVRGWQDSRAVHDLRASNGENAPWRQEARAVHSPTALCGAFWIHSTHILPKLAVFEYMQAIYCHEPVFFPSEAPF